MKLGTQFSVCGAAVALACLTSVASADITGVSTPSTAGQNGHYAGNRAPLIPNPLIKLPLGSVRPSGWLRHQLELEAKGFSGRLMEISEFCRFEGNGWTTAEGGSGVGWEEVPYWLRGYTNLGYLLDDPAIIKEANRWLTAVMATQRPDGYFGARGNLAYNGGNPKVKPMIELWPNMVMLYPLRSLYEVTGDARILAFLTKYFRWQSTLPVDQFIPRSWQKVRGGDNLDIIHWLYNQTGEAWLLDLARLTHERTMDWTSGIPNWHNVNFAEAFREPGQFYQQARDRKYLDATERNYKTMLKLYGQVPGGGYGGDEISRPGFNGARQGTETCGWVELMFSHEMLTGITGDPVWADRTEEIAFNSLPASMTADLKGLHYITSPNQVQLDAANKAPMIQRTGDMFSHDPHGYRCCQHNAAFGWPYFAEYSWMATRDNGLAAVLYAPGRVTAKVADGAEVTITETTDYPFDEAVTMRVSIAKPTKFPLLLRVPAWCDRPSLALNGKGLEVAKGAKGWLVVDRVWSKGDSVRLVLPMRITTRVWTENRNTVSVDRGPLTYSLKIGERWQKSGGTAEWPAFEVYPTTPWNYGLVVDPAKPEAAFEFVKAKGPIPAQPFNFDSAPVALRARAQRVPQWKLEPNGMVGEVQPGPVRSGEPVEKITLIPMGAARLRISAFPRVSAGPTAQTWHEQYPIAFSSSSSHYYPPSAALDGVVPSTSKDPKVRRFVWSKPKPEANYIEYRFSSPVRLSSAEVYWAEDDGECRLPASWSVSFLDGDRWRPVEGASGYATDRDKFNATRFIPVSTNAIRLEVRVQDQRTAGIMEWKVSE